MSAQSRATILAAVVNALRDTATTDIPPIWRPAQDRPLERLDLAKQFRDEIGAVAGEARFVPRAELLPAAIAAFIAERNIRSVAVADTPNARRAASLLPQTRVVDSDLAVSELALVDCSLLEASALLADTGSAIVIARGRPERLLAYLPRTCIIIASAAMLHASMSDEAMRPYFEAARDGGRGEAVIITGPSRTADIEKVLVLGAHGPQTLIAFISDIET